MWTHAEERMPAIGHRVGSQPGVLFILAMLALGECAPAHLSGKGSSMISQGQTRELKTARRRAAGVVIAALAVLGSPMLAPRVARAAERTRASRRADACVHGS
jgi:hypothetical protein